MLSLKALHENILSAVLAAALEQNQFWAKFSCDLLLIELGLVMVFDEEM